MYGERKEIARSVQEGCRNSATKWQGGCRKAARKEHGDGKEGAKKRREGCEKVARRAQGSCEAARGRGPRGVPGPCRRGRRHLVPELRSLLPARPGTGVSPLCAPAVSGRSVPGCAPRFPTPSTAVCLLRGRARRAPEGARSPGDAAELWGPRGAGGRSPPDGGLPLSLSLGAACGDARRVLSSTWVPPSAPLVVGSLPPLPLEPCRASPVPLQLAQVRSTEHLECLS